MRKTSPFANAKYAVEAVIPSPAAVHWNVDRYRENDRWAMGQKEAMESKRSTHQVFTFKAGERSTRLTVQRKVERDSTDHS